MNLIVAVDKEWGIGYKGDLLARVRADLRNFKKLTKNKTVILGSNTLATFPQGKPLPERLNLVLHPSKDFFVEGATVVHSIEECVKYLKDHEIEDATVIGGASVYRQMLPYCDTAYITKFEKSFEKDVYFENLDESPEWELVEEGEQQISDESTDTEGNLPFRFTVYKRK